MADRIGQEKPWVGVATRVPRSLHRRMKLHCVERGIPVMEFVRDALEEEMTRRRRGGRWETPRRARAS
jgi:hypothetical protein